ncbi:MAG: SynChlorMet cassette protein ScmC [Nitrospirae bacterium]|nr:SynChlorMet cassette protein ScmC [Nitrospirota bacterium]
MKANQTGYSLQLSSGDEWFLCGDNGLTPWLDKLASIMELRQKAQNGHPKIIFTKLNHGVKGEKYPPLPYFSNDEWICHDERIVRIWKNPSVPDVICEVRNDICHEIDILNMGISLKPIYQKAQEQGGLPLHAALAELHGNGILIAASGGTGKSTCSRRLPDHWKALCDDETLIVLDSQKDYQAHPFPSWSNYLWKRSETTWNVQNSVPLSAIFFLEQAETDEVVPVTEGQSAILINESANQVCRKFSRNLKGDDKRMLTNQIFNNACDMAKKIPAFILRAGLHGKFWEEMEEVISHLPEPVSTGK